MSFFAPKTKKQYIYLCQTEDAEDGDSEREKTRKELMVKKLEQLKKKCKELKVSQEGNKTDLAGRILAKIYDGEPSDDVVEEKEAAPPVPSAEAVKEEVVAEPPADAPAAEESEEKKEAGDDAEKAGDEAGDGGGGDAAAPPKDEPDAEVEAAVDAAVDAEKEEKVAKVEEAGNKIYCFQSEIF